MKLKKNVAAKIITILASLSALGGVWALVRTNPPASADTPTPVSTVNATAAAKGPSTAARTPTATPAVTQKKHTRTRVS